MMHSNILKFQICSSIELFHKYQVYIKKIDNKGLGLYATKNITCGEGGAIVTNNKSIYNKLCRLRLHGINNNFSERYNKKFSHWDMDELGYKCNMSDIQASILLPQIKKIGLLHHKRQRIYEHYLKKL